MMPALARAYAHLDKIEELRKQQEVIDMNQTTKVYELNPHFNFVHAGRIYARAGNW